jgi:hypothetical protein
MVLEPELDVMAQLALERVSDVSMVLEPVLEAQLVLEPY